MASQIKFNTAINSIVFFNHLRKIPGKDQPLLSCLVFKEIFEKERGLELTSFVKKFRNISKTFQIGVSNR